MNFFSNIYLQYKSAALFPLINRAFKLSSSYTLFHKEITFLSSYFQNNGAKRIYFQNNGLSADFSNGILKKT